VDCPPENVVPGLDAYILHNVTTYNYAAVHRFGSAPVIKRLHDVWRAGDEQLRRWILRHAALVIASSRLHIEGMAHRITAPLTVLPCAVDLAPFRQAAASANGRTGVCWLGRLYASKGIVAAAQWAQENGVTVDVYGMGALAQSLPEPLRYRGALTYAEVPGVLAQYERFLFLPDVVEPFGRAVVEAWAAGCEIVTNGNVGAVSWINEQPEALETAREDFWNAVKEALHG
jgi:glycosyltransferase involved in cell wall biosynthesis